MRYYRIRGTTEIIKASCMNEAIRKLVDNDMNLVLVHEVKPYGVG